MSTALMDWIRFQNGMGLVGFLAHIFTLAFSGLATHDFFQF